MSTQLTYMDALDKSYTLHTGAAFAGYAQANDLSLGATVYGGTALMVGAPLALKGTKKLVWDLPKWGYQNYGRYGEAFGDIKNGYRASYDTWKAERAFLRGDNFFQSVNNKMMWDELHLKEAKLPTSPKFDKAHYTKLLKEDPAKAKEYISKFRQEKVSANKTAKMYKTARAKINDIKARVKSGNLKGEALKKELQELDKLIGKADTKLAKAIESGAIKPKSGSTLSKIAKGLKKYTGIDAAGKAVNKGIANGAAKGATTGAKVTATGCKAVKGFVKGGGALTAAVELAFETPDIIDTYKQLGAGKGTKQLLKSTTVAVASGVGYAAGAWAGGKIGAVAGAAIGSCIPVVGNVVGGIIGGAIGVACGLLGSWLCGKAAKKAVGPSELEKAQKREAVKTAVEAYNDPKKMEELIAAYDSMINQRETAVAEGVEPEPQAEQLDYAA